MTKIAGFYTFGLFVTYAKGTNLDIKDRYTFTLAAQQSVTIRMNPVSEHADLDLYGFDEWMNPLYISSQGVGDMEKITATFPAGIYYIGVDAASGKSGYTLLIE